MIYQLIVRPVRVSEMQLPRVGCTLLPQKLTYANPHPRNQRLQGRAIRRAFQIFDHGGLYAGISKERRCIPRRTAVRVVITRHGRHGFTATSRSVCSYQPFERLTILTTKSMTGTSMSTPTTVASAAPE